MLKNERREYPGQSLNEEELQLSPMQLAKKWIESAVEAGLVDATAASLATATVDGRPSCRIVLIKDIDEKQLRFFTRYSTRKGNELAENPFAALCVYHGEWSHQLRIEGEISRLSQSESEEYFSSRPRGSQLSAWAASELSEIDGMHSLEERVSEMEARFPGKLPLPPDWGGYALKPSRIEFWVGKANRLHERLEYELNGAGIFVKRRLAP